MQALDGNTQQKILLVEDDTEISDMLKNFLATESFAVTTAYDGESACKKFFEDTYNLVLLDLMIPKKSGLEVMKIIRENSTVPIIILSAKDTDSDKTLGLGLGADDCDSEEGMLTKGALTINLNDYSVTKNGEPIELTAKEFEILKLLMKNPKKVYTKEQLYALVWKDVYVGDENAVNVHISRLRNKIEDNPRNPQYVLTVWGIGYKLGDAE